jgi:hypothetical protein
MIVETIILKSSSTNLEVVARYSKSYRYKLGIGESCYSAVIEYMGLEYVICTSKVFKTIYSIAELLTGLLNYPLAVNRVTKLKEGYNVTRDSVCVGAYSLSTSANNSTEDSCELDRSKIFDQYIIDEDDQMEINFDLTDRNWK